MTKEKMAPTAAQGRSLFTIFLFLSLGGSTVAQGLLPPVGLFGTGSHLCSYQYAIPTGEQCDRYGPALESRFKSTRQELDRFQQQYVSQNMLLMETIRQLRQQTSTADAEVADITKDFKDLQATVNTLQATIVMPNFIPGSNNNNNNINGGSGLGGGAGGAEVSDVMLEQLVTSTRQQVTQDMDKVRYDLNSALSALSKDRQAAAIQQSTVDSAFQTELNQQQRDLASVLQQLQQLQRRVSTLLTPLHPPAPRVAGGGGGGGGVVEWDGVVGVGVVTVEEVRSELRGLAGRVADVEDAVRGHLPDLRDNLTRLQQAVEKQTLDLSDARAEVDQVQNSEVPELQQKVLTNRGVLQQLRDKVNQDLLPLNAQVQDVARNVSALVTQINRLGSDTFSQLTQQRQDEVQVSDLSMQIRLLASRLSSVIRDQGLTHAPPSSTSPTPAPATTTPFPQPTPRSHS